VQRFAAATHLWRALPVGLADWAWQRRGRSLLTRAARDVPAYANLLRIFADSPGDLPRLQTSRRSYVQVFGLDQRTRRNGQHEVISFDPPTTAAVSDCPPPQSQEAGMQHSVLSTQSSALGTAVSGCPLPLPLEPRPVTRDPQPGCPLPSSPWPRARDELRTLRQQLIGLLDTWFDITRRRTLLVLALPECGWSSRPRISQVLQSAIADSRLPVTITDLAEARPISPSKAAGIPARNRAGARQPAPAAPSMAPLTPPETVFRLSVGFDQCIVLTSPAGAPNHAACLTQLPIKSGLMIFGPRPDALAADLPPSVPTCSVLGADEVGPLIAVETPLSRLILDLCRTHPSLPNRLLPKAFHPDAMYQPLPCGPWLEQAVNDLLVTSWGAAPVVRYRLGWLARIFSYSHLCDVLSREKTLPPRHLKRLTRIGSPCWKLPVIAVANR
jgi:hypothetical protein